MARRVFALVLLLAVTLGLTAPAMAQVPTASSVAATQPMGEDCAKMMRDHQQPQHKSCDGSLTCMLAMGCMTVNLVKDLAPSATATLAQPEHYWPAVAILRGASFAPEPDPPTTLD